MQRPHHPRTVPKPPTPHDPADPTPDATRPSGRNLWAVSGASFFTDISSEMVHHLIPLLLANVLGVRTAVIGLVEGVAETTTSLVQVASGTLSDRFRRRKWLAVAGYAISALAKPGFYAAGTWGAVAGVRWAERVGKGVRTAPRDALLADSVRRERRGLAFGVHRAADTAGAAIGLLLAALLVGTLQGASPTLAHDTFRTLVLWSLIPAVLGVVVLAAGAVEVAPRPPERDAPRMGFRGLGRPFYLFLGIVCLFGIGNFSDAFLILRAQERGIGVRDLLWVVLAFNVTYTVVSTPAGVLSDRWGRPRLLAAGWLVFAAAFTGFALAERAAHVTMAYVVYGGYYGLCTGTARAMVADLVPSSLRGTAFGTYHAAVGLTSLPASLLAGVLWQGAGPWGGLGPGAPFFLGAGTATAAALLLLLVFRE